MLKLSSSVWPQRNIHQIFIPLEKALHRDKQQSLSQCHSFLLSEINIVGSFWNRSDRCGPLITVSMVWCSAKPWQHGLCWKCVMLQKPNKHIDWNIDEAWEAMSHCCTCSNNQRIYFKTKSCMLFSFREEMTLKQMRAGCELSEYFSCCQGKT